MTNTMPKFAATRAEFDLIAMIAARAEALARANGDTNTPTRMDFMMDVEAAHSNGCRLDLAKLAAFPDFDFVHDVFGIRRHINRENGQLEDCFLPRCAV